ncbi:hypothetical protein J0910_18425 [Nocardiopsis sp. CNT-189]|uniref:hypothetical protein n=1 Tax=Nocardiopsis oceanisediminis TaxID=2816862 RepID=UPI003B2DE743
MTDRNAVVVPVRLSALAVTDPVRGTPFRRTRFDFSSAAEAGSAHQGLKPLPTDPANLENGVILHWELPAALRHQDAGSTQPPRVPDRWLVVRLHTPPGSKTRAATGWLVQSDCLRPDEGTPSGDNSAHAIPSASDPSLVVPKRIGRVLKLSGPLDEPAERAPLTALGAGVLEFAAFQPFNLGVFSLHDRLEGLPTDAALDLSYAVVGWHADSEHDPLAQAADPDALKSTLDRLGWTTAEAAEAGPYPGTRAVYAGNLVGVAWKKDARPEAVLEEKPEREDITFAVAESSAETLSALAMATDPRKWSEGENLRRLQALQYGLLDEYSDPSTRAAVQHRAHLARFEPMDGGYTWDILARPSEPGAPPSPFSGLSPQERAWLASANETQAAYDAGRRRLARLRERLYELWWYLAQVAWLRTRLSGLPRKLRGTYETRFAAVLSAYGHQLDPEREGGAARRITELQEELDGHERIFTTADPDELQAAIAEKTEELEKKWGRPFSGTLTRLPRPPFHTPTEPVVMLRGAKADRLVEHPTAQHCRTVTASDDRQLAAEVNGTAPGVPVLAGLGEAAVLPGARDLPSGLFRALLTEFTALDAGRPPATVTFRGAERAADWKAEDDVRLAALRAQRAPWRQPWTPLYLEWKARYYAVPYHDRREGRESERNWEFTDGMYQWRGAGHRPSDSDTDLVPRVLTGRILLSAGAVHNIRRRYGGMAEDAPAQPASFTKALKKLMGSGSDLDLIAQALDGFTARLTGRAPLLARPPRSPIAPLIADGCGQAPSALDPNMNRPSGLNPAPEDYLSPPPFEPLRAGQFYFDEVAVVDRFGRSIDIVNPNQGPAARDRPTRSATLLPDDRSANGKPNGKADAIVFSGDAEHRKKELVHLRPRLVQPARLSFDALSRTGGAPVTRPLDGEQISGWLLPNDFDQGLLFYDHEGLLLGGLRQDPDASSGPVWEKYAAAEPNAHLAGIRDGLTGHASPGSAMREFLQATGAARATIGPEAESSARHPSLHMLGRPLAVVRARLDLEADAGATVPIRPALLAAADPAPDPDYRDYTWPVLLGSTRSAQDGLVGYYIDSGTDAYKALYTVPEPAEGAVYTRSRANGAALGQSLKAAPHTLTLLADPWAPVHAWTHVLPTAELRLEPEPVQAALARMEAVFHVGPAVGTLRASERKGEDGRPLVDAFSLPLPAVEHGDWSWTDDGSTTPVPLTPADPSARIEPKNRTHVRTGLLRLRPERETS